MNDWAGIGWLVVLLAVNAFFVASEFAVISARRSQIEPLAEEGRRSARVALGAMEHATLMLSTTQLGITVASLLILNVSEPSIHHLLEVPLHLTGLPEEATGVVAFVITLLLVTFLHVVFGEMVPKNVAFSVPDRAVLLLATPLVFVERVFRPLIYALNGTTNALVRLVGVEPKDEANSSFTLDEVETIVETSRREGTLDDASGTLSAAFEFTEKQVADVTVPLAEIVGLPASATPDDLERAVAQSGFSRYPLVDAGGKPVGYLHLKDVLELAEWDRPIPGKLVRRLISVSAGTELEDALAVLRRDRQHLARVVEQDGAVRGILFLEDVIEELVGEVQDATRR
ncbi:hemolysin family protein [Amnibacterium setariae]|uniref:HlyC/CorC family transporter n=1 Tax=Amnibacterium setariae TaxID=2306585 RepID=A0A3A1UD26_9MICO|nr:hemolysin family protein [Amnibacterium setariae]RIX31006.1 HlyC/CorC family transporter [Amnibacterium setariae]